MTAAERPAGRPACGARPAGAPERTEYRRLVAAGVSAPVAAVLAAGPQPSRDDERAYWRQLTYRRATTEAQRAAHAAAQRQRRRRAAQHTDTSRRTA